MDLPDPLRRALERLDGAVRALEAAAERQAGAEAEHLALRDDRARLAAALDAALARNGALERVAGEVSARVERAGEAVRGVLADLAAASGPA